MTKRTTATACCVVVLGLGAAATGCGDDDREPSAAAGAAPSARAPAAKGGASNPRDRTVRGTDEDAAKESSRRKRTTTSSTRAATTRSAGSRSERRAAAKRQAERPRRAGTSKNAGRTTAAPVDTSGPARFAYVDRGDATCRRFRQRRDELGPQPEGKEARAKYFARLADHVADAIAEFEASPAPPDRGQRTITSYLGELKVVRDELRGVSAAAARGDRTEQVQRSRKIQNASARANAFAQRYGFTVCGSPN